MGVSDSSLHEETDLRYRSPDRQIAVPNLQDPRGSHEFWRDGPVREDDPLRTSSECDSDESTPDFDGDIDEFTAIGERRSQQERVSTVTITRSPLRVRQGESITFVMRHDSNQYLLLSLGTSKCCSIRVSKLIAKKTYALYDSWCVALILFQEYPGLGSSMFTVLTWFVGTIYQFEQGRILSVLLCLVLGVLILTTAHEFFEPRRFRLVLLTAFLVTGKLVLPDDFVINPLQLYNDFVNGGNGTINEKDTKKKNQSNQDKTNFNSGDSGNLLEEIKLLKKEILKLQKDTRSHNLDLKKYQNEVRSLQKDNLRLHKEVKKQNEEIQKNQRQISKKMKESSEKCDNVCKSLTNCPDQNYVSIVSAMPWNGYDIFAFKGISRDLFKQTVNHAKKCNDRNRL